MTLRRVCAAVILVLAGVGRADPAPVDLPDELKRIEAALVERAAELLERYGTTFYALAAYIDAEQQMRPLVPERSAPLEPEAIAAALREALIRIPPSHVRAAGLVLDVPSERRVRIQLETMGGVCHRLTRPYSFDETGRVTFREASRTACASRLHPGS